MADSARLLAGLGTFHRGDDAVGPVVVREVQRRLGRQPDALRVSEQEDPSFLLSLFEGVDLAVVVDAVRTGGIPGTIVVWEISAGASDLPPGFTDPRQASTHALGLASVVALARSLDRLPQRLVVVGIEAGGFEIGGELSGPVRASVAAAAETVMKLLAVPPPNA